MFDFSDTEEGLVLVSKSSAIGPSFGRSASNKKLFSKILRSVPESEGSLFYLEIGKPTGQTAISLTDFLEKLGAADVQSINFHYSRKDFRKWIREVFGDA